MKGYNRIPRYLSCFSLFSSSSSASLGYSSVHFSPTRVRIPIQDGTAIGTSTTTTVFPFTHPSPPKPILSVASASTSLFSRSIFSFQRHASDGAPVHSRAYHNTTMTTMSRMTGNTNEKKGVTSEEEACGAKKGWKKRKRFPWTHTVAVVATRWFYRLLHPHPCPLSALSWTVDTYDFSHGRIPQGSFMDLLRTTYAEKQQEQKTKQGAYRREEVVTKSGADKALDAAVGNKTNRECEKKREREIATLSPLPSPPPPSSSCTPSFFLPFSGSREMFEEQVAHTPGIVVVLLYARGWGIAIHEEARQKREDKIRQKRTQSPPTRWWGRRKAGYRVVPPRSRDSLSLHSSSAGGASSATSTGQESGLAGKTTRSSGFATRNAVSTEAAHSEKTLSTTPMPEGKQNHNTNNNHKKIIETYEEEKEEDENAVLWEGIAIPTAERTEQQKRNRVALENMFSLYFSSSSSTGVERSHGGEEKSFRGGTTGGGTSSSTAHLRTAMEEEEDTSTHTHTTERVQETPNGGKHPSSKALPSSPPGVVLLPPFQCWTMNVYASADHMELAYLYDFRATPMWLGFRDGVFLESVEGGHPNALLTFVESLLLNRRTTPPAES